MPRLIPRVLAKLASTSKRPSTSTSKPAVDPSWPARVRPRLGPKVKRAAPVPPSSSFSFSPADRTSSVLLEHNPITHPKHFARAKRLPPDVRRRALPRTRLATDGKTVLESTRPRRMTVLERSWWANPYLRMLASPVRRCIISHRYYPRDLLVRIIPVRVPGPRHDTSFVPDGLEHPKYKNSRWGWGHYFVCRRTAVAEMHRRPECYRPYASTATLPSSLDRYISHLLRLRVLQELEMLALRLRTFPRNARSHPILRRLTRVELANLRASESVPWTGAVAIIIVPPVNKDASTKRRIEGSMSAMPESDASNTSPKRPPLPTSVLLRGVGPDSPAQLEDEGDASHSVDWLPNAMLPLYNGASLFPSRTHRAALHEKLCRVLAVERSARERDKTRTPTSPSSTSSRHSADKGADKMSHAFLLCSDAQTLLRADSVPLAIALWRLRMWEGGGSEETRAVGNGGWDSFVSLTPVQEDLAHVVHTP